MYSSTVIFQPLSAVLSFSAGVNCCIPELLISSPTQLFWDYQQGINILFQYLLVFSSCSVIFVFQLEVIVISKHNYFLASLGWLEFSCSSWLLFSVKQNNIHKDPGMKWRNLPWKPWKQDNVFNCSDQNQKILLFVKNNVI